MNPTKRNTALRPVTVIPADWEGMCFEQLEHALVMDGTFMPIDGQHRINALKSTLDAILPDSSNKEEV